MCWVECVVGGSPREHTHTPPDSIRVSQNYGPRRNVEDTEGKERLSTPLGTAVGPAGPAASRRSTIFLPFLFVGRVI